VQIAERRDGRDVVVVHVGTARTDADLAVLMAQARRRLHEGQETLDLEIVGLEDEGVPQRPGLITSKRSALSTLPCGELRLHPTYLIVETP